MIDFPEKERYDWRDLLVMIRLLRSAEGCPWDRVQTHESIRRNFLEETWEALDAIDRDNPADMCEELGDVLMQVAFHAQIETERGRFTMDDVVDGVTRKLLYRHPHVFGDASAGNSEQALANWDARKRLEKGHVMTSDAIEAVPHTLPALWRTEKICKKASRAGFDWENVFHALDKLEEEVRELRQALEQVYGSAEAQSNADTRSDSPAEQTDSPHGIRDEVGDTLFITARIAQMCGLDPEDALHRACDKFNRRFRLMESAAEKPLSGYSEDELIRLWKNAKVRAYEEDGKEA